MRRVVAAVLGTRLLGGCATSRGRTMYAEPGASDAQKAANEAECTRAAIDTAGPRPAAFLAVDRDAVDACMQARGYRVIAPK